MSTRRIAIVAALLCAVVLAAGAADKPVMSLMCFAGYAEDSWVKPFEEKYGCTVKVNYAGTVEEMFAKVKAAPNEYNIVSIDPGRIPMYNKAGLLQPVDTKKLSNYMKIGAFFREHPYNKILGGATLHIPIVWGTQTITVNVDKVPAAKLAKYVEQQEGDDLARHLHGTRVQGPDRVLRRVGQCLRGVRVRAGHQGPLQLRRSRLAEGPGQAVRVEEERPHPDHGTRLGVQRAHQRGRLLRAGRQ